jgi:acyl-CoA reductase-like NAD-dependent aldehyde dehydrogenase
MGKYLLYERMPIDSTWKEGSSNSHHQVTNPYNQEVLADIKLANIKDIDDAYKVAEKAQVEWEKVSAFEKAKVMEKAATLIEDRRDEITRIIMEETAGFQPIASRQIQQTLEHLKEASTFPMKMNGLIQPALVPGKENRVYRIPIGVVGVISPWNAPFYLSMRSVAAALATGNGVVIKPDLQTPISGGLLIARIFEDAGLPRGLLNVTIADLADIGDAFIEHPIPRVISFTGSSTAGRHIGAICGQHFKKACLELGGNSPFIVLEDADIDQAVAASVYGRFLHQGQVCMAINRMIVVREVYQQFVKKLLEKVQKLPIGDPAEGAVIGPLINQKQVDKLLNMIEKSIQEGANPILEGKVNGQIVEPWVLIDAKNDMTISKNEAFGPVATVIPVDNEEEAVRIANDTEYGLSAAVFSSSLQRGVQVAKRIKAGMVHVNDQTINHEVLCPFGGEKASGMGRHNSKWALEEFTSFQWLSIQEQPRTFPF